VTASRGIDFRLRRLLPGGRALLIPLDHALTAGPGGGLADPAAIVANAAAGGADAVMLRPGLTRALAAPGAERLAVIAMLTGRLTRGIDHIVLNSVQEAIACGADAICGEFKFGSRGDLENAAIVARLAEEAHRCGLPAVVTVYAVSEIVNQEGPAAYAHACRVAEELGADVIKTALPPHDADVIAEVLSCVGVPVLIAGGARDDSDLASVVQHAVSRGIAGAAIGRNAWGSPDPVATIRRLAAAVHGNDNNR
jgi:DhnA family fructose-bisphosphate aldolase class Ia